MNNSDAVQNFRFFRFWAEILQIVTFAFRTKIHSKIAQVMKYC